MALNAKKRAHNRALLVSQKSYEPTLDQDNFTNSLGRALTHYSQNTGSKEQKLYALEFFNKKEPKIAKQLKKLSDHSFQTFGSLCRLMTNEQTDISQLTKESKWFTTKLKELLANAAKIAEEVQGSSTPTAPVVSIQDRIYEKASELAGEIEGEIDAFCETKTTTFSTKNFLLSNSVSAPVAKRIGEFYVGLSAELHEAIAGKDEQLNEGYKRLTKRQLKKFAEFIDSIIADCNQQVQSAKATRVVRKRAVNPIKVVAKMKYMKTFDDFKLKSINPVDIIGSTEVWIYNTKYRRVTVYKADGGALAVKGTTLLGFDVQESKTMTLRKPEEFFKGLSMGKRALNGAFKKLTTKPAVPNGRVNEECIILGAF
tara:strand:- start:5891 stop:7000 length:1110 start_codon:yes stop_codon:yes gene_type:complete